MLSEKMEKAFNDQLNAELVSYYIYLSMSAWFKTKSLDGFANWMNIQAQEEMIHAMKFYNHIIERDSVVKLQPIEGPPVEWKSPLDVFETAYKHEQYITGRINDLVRLAMEGNDFASHSFLQWFVDEQVEEEASALAVVDQLKMVGSDTSSLFMLDREMGQRQLGPAE